MGAKQVLLRDKFMAEPIKALDKGIITKNKGSYKHNRVVIGLTEEATIVWLKENADIYALMKQELRGNVSVEIKPTKKSKVK